MSKQLKLSRRDVLASLGATCAVATIPGSFHGAAASSQILSRAIPKTGEKIPLVGMGSSVTFNVGDDEFLRDDRTDVLRAFFKSGGGLIDSSPMYGSSEEVIGYGLKRLGLQEGLFSATKVWTWRHAQGPSQMEASRNFWGVEKIDLMQIHNLVSWEQHLETLLEMKAKKQIRYIGITTSHGRRHDDFVKVMETKPIDFVQFTYNVLDREAERRLLPIAAERKLAVVINRPFRRGDLFNRFEKRPLPSFASEIDCSNWAQYFLKFIISHPAVTCAIPATTRVDHMIENMGAARGRLPDSDLRARMLRYIANV